MYDRGAEMYKDGYVDGADEVLSAVADYLSDDVIDYIKNKKLEYYKLWKEENE